LNHLGTEGFASYGTSPHVLELQNVQLADVTDTPENVAIWFGSESKGLTEVALQNMDTCVQIAMRGTVESINLACATAVVLHHFSNLLKQPS
jgi:tRNA (guanosine-2'-O-)-methyltransferase